MRPTNGCCPSFGYEYRYSQRRFGFFLTCSPVQSCRRRRERSKQDHADRVYPVLPPLVLHGCYENRAVSILDHNDATTVTPEYPIACLKTKPLAALVSSFQFEPFHQV